jgi:hypothetical protein
VSDLNIPVVIKWQGQDGVIGGPIPCSSYTAAIKSITCMQGNRLPSAQINTYWVESIAPELTFKKYSYPSGE